MYFKLAFFFALFSALLSSALSLNAEAKIYVTLPEALAAAFPAAKKCETKTETRYLTTAQVKEAAAAAGDLVPSALVVRYVATCDGKPGGFAYTDTHRVRTHPESLFIALSAQGKIDRVETLSFDEPLEYRPNDTWYARFFGLTLGPGLQVKQQVPFVTGASLTTRATVEATRRVLAIHAVLEAPPGPAP